MEEKETARRVDAIEKEKKRQDEKDKRDAMIVEKQAETMEKTKILDIGSERKMSNGG